MSKTIEIGWMGGTYNPPHDLHMLGGQSVVEQLDMEKLLMGPNGIPPHKSKAGILDGPVRLHLLQLSIEGNTRLEASSLELDRSARTGEPSFTVDTLKELTEHFDTVYGPGCIRGSGRWRLNCVVGEDVIPDFRHWRDAEGIKKLARLVIIPRYSGVDAAKEEKWREQLAGAEILITRGHAALDVSSTWIRQMIKAGSQAWRYLVRPKVYDYIVTNGLLLDQADPAQKTPPAASAPVVVVPPAAPASANEPQS
jgi:nicotinate-nucleotide adenylyltransferase